MLRNQCVFPKVRHCEKLYQEAYGVAYAGLKMMIKIVLQIQNQEFFVKSKEYYDSRLMIVQNFDQR